jgi:hypothetical protein
VCRECDFQAHCEGQGTIKTETMRLQDFVRELRDNSPDWIGLFEKYDCVFVANIDEFPAVYERFKQELVEILFELRYGYQHLCEQIDTYYEIRLQERASGCSDVLKSFLEAPNRPAYLVEPERFLEALRRHAEAEENHLKIGIKKFVELTSELLHVLSDEITHGSLISKAVWKNWHRVWYRYPVRNPTGSRFAFAVRRVV